VVRGPRFATIKVQPPHTRSVACADHFERVTPADAVN
jgi:hypothetical protein